MKLKSLLFLLFAFLVFPATLAQDKQTLNVYTYDSFSSEWGPGPKLKQQFESTCNCELNFVALDDALAVLGRLKLEAQDSPADVVVGLDMNTLNVAKETGLFASHEHIVFPDLSLPQDWVDEIFIPFDYGYFAFIYDSEKLKKPANKF